MLPSSCESLRAACDSPLLTIASIFLFIFFWASCLDATQFLYVAEIVCSPKLVPLPSLLTKLVVPDAYPIPGHSDRHGWP